MVDANEIPLLPERMTLATEAARSAAEFILSGFRSESLTVQLRSDGSSVTQFDREAETLIRAFIARPEITIPKFARITKSGASRVVTALAG